MPLTTNIVRCEACVYWLGGSGVGECRRHAPLPIPVEMGRFGTVAWPLTSAVSGCGDGEVARQ
jgi:hypothetical protein